jgi:hypothetical protein
MDQVLASLLVPWSVIQMDQGLVLLLLLESAQKKRVKQLE